MGTNALRLRHHAHGSPTVCSLTVWYILHTQKKTRADKNGQFQPFRNQRVFYKLPGWYSTLKKHRNFQFTGIKSLKDIHRFVWSTLAASNLVILKLVFELCLWNNLHLLYLKADLLYIYAILNQCTIFIFKCYRSTKQTELFMTVWCFLAKLFWLE